MKTELINRYALVMRDRRPVILAHISDELETAKCYLDGVKKDGCRMDACMLQETARLIHDLATELVIMDKVEERAGGYEDEVVLYPPVD